MTDLSRWITQPRIDEYLVAANHEPGAARELYEWNIGVSAAFFELISHVEIALRNAVDRIMQPLEFTETARVRPWAGWWFASGSFLTDHDLAFHTSAVRHLRHNAESASRDKMLASMTFGIWDAIFGPSYEQLFRRHLVHAFPHRPAGFTRDSVQKNVLALRNLRNRIAHHQAIFDLPLEERFEQAMDLLRWIDPDLERWVAGLCRVSDLLDSRPKAADSIAVVVPAREAWPFYVTHSVYICQPGRFFRQVSHIGFYAEGQVQPEVPKILQRLDPVDWRPSEIARRLASRSTNDTRIAEVIRDGRAAGWDGDEYQLFLLTRPDEEGRRKGHVTMASALRRQRSGRGSAWVRRQRYVGVDTMQAATALSDLDPE